MISLDEVKRIRTSGLPASARHIFMELSIRSNKNGECWPSIRTIARDTGYSENHIRKMIKLLEKTRWINIHPRPRQSNKFEIRPVSEGNGHAIPPAPRAVPPPSPGEPPPPAPGAIPPAPGDAEALQESEYPLHEDLKDHEQDEELALIQKAWEDRKSPRWRKLDVTQAQQLIDRYPAQEIVAAINSWKHPNDLNPYLLEDRISLLRDFPEFRAP